jgi:cyclase
VLQTRVIPILLLKNGGLYKGVKFKNHKYIGDPINTVKIFNDKEVDELVILDIESSRYKKPIDFELLHQIATEAFMPLAYGGGISSLEDAKRLFSIGFEKVILNTNAIDNMELLHRLVSNFGSQSIIVSIDIKKSFLGEYRVYTKSGSFKTKYKLVDFVKKMEEIGVGEIVLNSIERDGVMKGYDLNIIKKITDSLSIPLIAVGGAGDLEDMREAKMAGASAVGAGSMFVYHGVHKAVLISYPKYEILYKLFKES